jgi:hypothetical protein
VGDISVPLNVKNQKNRRLLSGGITLADQSRDDAGCCVLGIQGIAQFLTEGVVFLPGRKNLKDNSVVFVLQGVKESGNGGVGGWARWGCFGGCWGV